MPEAIGFLHALKLDWLQRTSDLCREGKSSEEIRAVIERFLPGDVASRFMQIKIQRMLLELWVNPDEELEPIRTLALTDLELVATEQLAFQYALLLTHYPIFADAAGYIWKIVSMQDSFTTKWLRTRLYERWGERDIINAVTRYILQTMVDIGCIRRHQTGIYSSEVVQLTNPKAIQALVIALLTIKKTYLDLSVLSTSAHLFPFRFQVPAGVLTSDCFELQTFGGKRTITLRGMLER